MPVPRYHLNLFWSAEDEAWIADVPDLGSVSAHGEKPARALREVGVAVEAAVAVLRAGNWHACPESLATGRQSMPPAIDETKPDTEG